MVVNKTKGAIRGQAPPKADNTEAPTASKTGRTGRPRSPARSRSPGRRSPGRAKKELSPPPLKSSTPKVPVPTARSPIKRSPARKSPTRSPSRKSPTRSTRVVTTKSAETYLTERVVRPRRTKVEMESDSDTPDGDAFGYSEKPHAAVKGRARRLEIQVEKLNLQATEAAAAPSTFNIIKRMTHNSQNREVERIVHLKHVDHTAKKLGEFSDEDENTQLRKSVSTERGGDFKQITEFGGSWGALFYILVTPLSVIALHILCNEDQCSFVKIPDYRKYLLLSTYFHLPSLLGFTGFTVLVALLSVIPFGGKQIPGMPTKQGKFIYIMNGMFCCTVLVGLLIGLELKSIPITQFIVKHFFHLLIASILFGFSLTTYAFVRSFYVPFSHLNVHAIGKSKIYGFFMGREICPRAFGLLDLKMYIARLTLIASVFLDFSYLATSMNWTAVANLDVKSLNISSTLLVLVLLHTIYHLDGLIFEAVFLTSFEVQTEGFGYILGMGYLIYPFMTTSVTKYVVNYNIQLAGWKLILIGMVFAFGYFLFRGANNQKDAFRKNPYDPALSHLETIPTTKGKKLLCSGFWGVVRHPNYLGDILIHLVLIPFAFDVPPLVTSLVIVNYLLYRTVRDHKRCKQKYGAAWDRYCNKVKYILLPKVY